MRTDSIKKFYARYEHYVSPAAFLAGFAWDNLTLRRIDLWFENLIFLIYIFVAGAIILLINLKTAYKYTKFFPIVLQFAFGGLFSAFIVFYSRSASLVTSWPFLAALAAILVGNEIFKKQYLRLVFQLSIFFVALFSYSIFAVPIIAGRMGVGIFILSGAISLFLIGLAVFLLKLAAPERIKQSLNLITLSILSIYFLFNVLYFTNIIPPIPLSLKGAGIYHNVRRIENNQYFVSFEKRPWYSFFKNSNPEFHWAPPAPVYTYSAVFAPAKLDTKIFHLWFYFDEKKDEWVQKSRIGFVIVGGRDGGYRGYTMKTNIAPGQWRVDIATERGQILGRMKFKVIEVSSPPELETALR